jgi:integrase/recombinase XerC
LNLPEGILEQYELHLRDEDKAEGTIELYLIYLRAMGFPSITIDDLIVYFRDKHLKSRSGKIAAMRSFLGFLEENDVISSELYRNSIKFFKYWRKRKSTIEKWAIPKAEWNNIIRKAPKKNKNCKMILWTLFNFGLRINEALHLRIDDIDFKHKQIIIQEHLSPEYWRPKSYARKIPMNERQEKVLKKWIEAREIPDTPYLFVHLKYWRKGKRIGKDCVYNWFKKIHPDLRSHVCRYSYATNLYTETKDIVLVKEVLGHSNIAVTSEYLNPDKKEIDDKIREVMA